MVACRIKLHSKIIIYFQICNSGYWIRMDHWAMLEHWAMLLIRYWARLMCSVRPGFCDKLSIASGKNWCLP